MPLMDPMGRVLTSMFTAALALAALAAPAGAQARSAHHPKAHASVVGGVAAGTDAIPWQALVLPGDFLCGGSIVDATHVLTAAHCVTDPDDVSVVTAPSSVQVFAGLTSIAARFQPGVQRPAVAAVTVDPQYDHDTGGHDEALLTLATPLDFSGPAVRPIALAPVGWTPTSATRFTLSGWGHTQASAPNRDNSGDPLPDALQVNNAIQPSNGCGVYVSGTTGLPTFDSSLMVCAGQVGADACQGDSGGPLAVQIDGVWNLAGIVSSGAGCGYGYPGIYTRVASPATATFLSPFARGSAGNQQSFAPPPQPGTTPDPTPPTPPVETPTTPTPPPALPQQPAVIAKKPAGDSVAPTSKVTKVSCKKTVCTLDVRVTDPAPSAGIAGLTAQVTTSYKTVCGKANRACTKKVVSKLKAVRQKAAGTYRITTPKLRKGSAAFRLVAADAAGNQQRRPTTLTRRL
jgi:hypothetical protein